MEPWTEERVRSVLATIASLPEAQRGIFGAKLGTLMRQVAPDFKPDVLGDRRLTDLLLRFPDLATLTQDPTVGHLVVRFSPPGAREAVPPDAIPTDARTTNGADRAGEFLDPNLWKALVRSRADSAWFLDLETIQVVEVPVDLSGNIPAESEPGRTPARFLAIPPIPQDECVRRAREYVDGLAQAELKEELSELLDRERGFNLFFARAQALGLKDWKSVHRRFVVGRAKAWLAEHDVRPEKFIRPATIFSPSAGFRHVEWGPRRDHAPSGPLGRPDIRALVLKAVARMPEEDLLDLRIALRYLL
jgi:OST-HTH/LOTUS domain